MIFCLKNIATTQHILKLSTLKLLGGFDFNIINLYKE